MQHHRIPFLHRLAVGVAAAALAGCSSTGTITDGNNTTGRDSKGGGNAGGNGTAGGVVPQPSATKPGTSAGRTGPKWVISMPDSITGFPQVKPDNAWTQVDNAWIQQSDSQLRAALQVHGVTGQTVRGIYDDARDDYYLIVYGVNGNGINPADVVSTDNAQKDADAASRNNPNITVQYSRVDPGPHGGDDTCQYTTIVQPFDGGFGPTTVVSTGALCFWSTTTTAGLFTFLDKGDLKQSGYNGAVTPDIAGQTMAAVRDAVEHQEG